jgi:DHA1 family multidrug resistance protein-like MFS transporter
MDTIRESPLGQLLRAITGNRILLYPEEKPGFVLPANLGQKGHPVESDQSLSDSPITPAPASYFPPGANSEGGHVQDEANNIVGWYGPDDPSNPRNWSSWKKRLVTFQIWYMSPHIIPLHLGTQQCD